MILLFFIWDRLTSSYYRIIVYLTTKSDIFITPSDNYVIIDEGDEQSMAALRNMTILVYGSSQNGKSSLINTLCGCERTPTGDGGRGCTFSYRPIVYPRYNVRFIDTVGLNEGDNGLREPKEAIKQLLEILAKYSINLVILVNMGGFSETFYKNYKLMQVDILEGKVPCLIVINGADGKGDEELNAMEVRYRSDLKECKGNWDVTPACNNSSKDDIFKKYRIKIRKRLLSKCASSALFSGYKFSKELSVFKEWLNKVCEFVGLGRVFYTNVSQFLVSYGFSIKEAKEVENSIISSD